MDIRTILVPVDLTACSERALMLASELARCFGARLVLHHNESVPALGLGRGWDWEAVTNKRHGMGSAIDAGMRELLARVPEGVEASGTITRGHTFAAIVTLARALPADLIVVESHGPDSLDHTSITQLLLEQAPCPVLGLQEGHDEGRPLLRQAPAGTVPYEALVATDFSPAGDAAVDYALGLLARLPSLRLRVIHVLRHDDPAPPGQVGKHAGAAVERLLSRISPALRGRTEVQVLTGPAGATIVDACASERAAFVVMGEHATGLRGLLTHDTAREVLRSAPCPVWYVPPQRPAH